MLTEIQAMQLKAASRRIAVAEVADSWAGAGHPEDIPHAEEELRLAKAAFKLLLDQLTETKC